MMRDGGENFVSRWVRLKQEARAAAAEKPARGESGVVPELPVLPALDSLDFNSDFTGFLHPAVDEKIRSTALKKLFSDPRFNVMDGLDVYIDDYSRADPIPPAMLEEIARRVIAATEPAEGERTDRAAQAPDAIAAETGKGQTSLPSDAAPTESPAAQPPGREQVIAKS
jgi:hypothetical protein